MLGIDEPNFISDQIKILKLLVISVIISNLFLIELMFRFPVTKFFEFSKLYAWIETKVGRESFSETIRKGKILETC